MDHHHIEYNSKLNAALNDTDFLKRIDNNQNRAREFIQAIANNSLSDNQITINKFVVEFVNYNLESIPCQFD